MTTEDTTMNEIADSLDDAAENLDGTLLHEGNDIQEFASKTVYSTFYYFSYGVCFVGFLAGKVIPKTGVVGQGLRDGSQAAREAVERITAQKPELEGEFGDPISFEADGDEETEEEIAETPKRTSGKSRRSKKSA